MTKIVKQKRHDTTIVYGYYISNGDFVEHNENEPAVIFEDGEIQYRNHGRLHRIGGPALIYDNNQIKEYLINGKIVTSKVNDWLDERDLNIDNLGNEDYLALCMFMESLNG